VAKFDSNRKLVDIIEKLEQPPSNYAVIGVEEVWKSEL